jgi:hypothetical protein
MSHHRIELLTMAAAWVGAVGAIGAAVFAGWYTRLTYKLWQNAQESSKSEREAISLAQVQAQSAQESALAAQESLRVDREWKIWTIRAFQGLIDLFSVVHDLFMKIARITFWWAVAMCLITLYRWAKGGDCKERNTL